VLGQGRPSPKGLHKITPAGLAYVLEQCSVISGPSTLDNLRLGRGGVPAALAHFPELGRLLGRKAGLLSGGEQQMLTRSAARRTGAGRVHSCRFYLTSLD
jgi:branched-chain amino acid transport system ATP-binding protein